DGTVRPTARLVGDVDSLRDVRRLCADGNDDAARSPVEALGRGVVPDVDDRLADERRDVHRRGRTDLTGDVDEAGGNERLDCDSTVWVLRQHRVEDGVADLVSDLVGMSFGHRLRGREEAGSGRTVPHGTRLPCWQEATVTSLPCGGIRRPGDDPSLGARSALAQPRAGDRTRA